MVIFKKNHLNYAMVLGENLRKLRITSGKTVKDIALMLGIKTSSYYKYEANKSSPSVLQVYSICNYLKCDANYLYGFEDSKQNQKERRILEIIHSMPESYQTLALLVVVGLKGQLDTLEIAGGKSEFAESIVKSLNDK